MADDTNLLGPVWSSGCVFTAGAEVELQGLRNNGPKLRVKVLELKRPSLIEHDAVSLDDGLVSRNVTGNTVERGAGAVRMDRFHSERLDPSASECRTNSE